MRPSQIAEFERRELERAEREQQVAKLAATLTSSESIAGLGESHEELRACEEKLCDLGAWKLQIFDAGDDVKRDSGQTWLYFPAAQRWARCGTTTSKRLLALYYAGKTTPELDAETMCPTWGRVLIDFDPVRTKKLGDMSLAEAHYYHWKKL